MIDTVVDGIKLSHGLEKLAGVMDQALGGRSRRAADLGRLLQPPSVPLAHGI